MNTEVTTEMMNEVIGIFMEYKMYDKRYPRNHGVGAPEAEPEKCMIIQRAKYHTSWDWLMPVAEMLKDKLYGLWNDNQIQERPQMEISLNTNTIKLVDVETGWCLIDPISKDTLKETVYHACYEIIKWLNQQKQTNDERGTNKG